MTEWILQGDIILRVGGLILLILFSFNLICWVSSAKWMKLPLGDFIIIGFFLSLIFFNQAGLKSLANMITEVFDTAVSEVSGTTDDLMQDVDDFQDEVQETSVAVQKEIDNASSALKAFPGKH